ncbi:MULTISPECIES: hypothetical protein [unclassified Sphingobacterium]|uniref:hypothetical protein n=1 Tax=unclassified Sphingobacterium TaxID=2609468 RepID=UPI0029546838|nr:hypothetical protein [Sphingobacterium sp. UGAL515B_05]WON95233.1 hypothetical protein OK025_02165 [Sphingobacterium sp. UGAL515B_05]
MKISKLFAFVLLCASCKKDHESYQDLYSKADKKLAEIENLIKKSSCNDLSNWQVDTIMDGIGSGHRYFPVNNTIKSDYEKLKATYLELLNSARKTDPRPILNDIFTPETHFEIGCIEGHPKVLLASDFSAEQVRDRLSTNIEELERFYSNKTCNGSNNWYVRPIVKDCQIKYVLHYIGTESGDNFAFSVKYNQYKALSSRLAQLDSNYATCENSLAPQKHVICENHIPVIID